jgi:predicted DNA-binding transcriptional regulator AlpA
VDADENEETARYWSHQQLAKGLHLSRAHLYRLLEEGSMLGPDIVIAEGNVGWDPKRAQRFGVDTDRLNADFQPIGPPPDGSLAKARLLVKGTYSKVPSVYVSSWLASYIYGLGQNAVYFMRSRNGGSFIPADVMIAGKYGWSEPRVIEYGEQTGRLADAGIDRWVVRRTRQFGLSPQIRWVQDRIAARPWLEEEVASALEAWRQTQAQKAAN